MDYLSKCFHSKLILWMYLIFLSLCVWNLICLLVRIFPAFNPLPAEFLIWNNLPSSLVLSIIFRDIKLRNWSWSANSIEPDQIAEMCRLDRLYTGGETNCLVPAGKWLNIQESKQRLITVSSGRIRVKIKIDKKYWKWY